jgi:hypothetical protein
MVLGADTQYPRDKIDKIFEFRISSEIVKVTDALSISGVKIVE